MYRCFQRSGADDQGFCAREPVVPTGLPSTLLSYPALRLRLRAGLDSFALRAGLLATPLQNHLCSGLCGPVAAIDEGLGLVRFAASQLPVFALGSPQQDWSGNRAQQAGS